MANQNCLKCKYLVTPGDFSFLKTHHNGKSIKIGLKLNSCLQKLNSSRILTTTTTITQPKKNQQQQEQPIEYFLQTDIELLCTEIELLRTEIVFLSF